ncbi:MAG: fatty acid desaturase [Geminicoccaceae bacterium]
MSGSTIPTRSVTSGLNIAYAILVGTLTLVVLFGVPSALPAGNDWGPWLVLAYVLATVPHWAFVHEAVHDHFHERRVVNEAAGRLLSLLFLAPFDGLRFGHLSHHALNARASERPEFYDPRRRSGRRAAIAYYLRLLCGIYLLEVASGPRACCCGRWCAGCSTRAPRTPGTWPTAPSACCWRLPPCAASAWTRC